MSQEPVGVETFAAYELASKVTDILPPEDVVLPLLGLTGEVGGLVAEYKKQQRDITGYRAFRNEVREELGDALWYIAALARRCDLSLAEIASWNLEKTRDVYVRPATPPEHHLFDDDASVVEQLPRHLRITFHESALTQGSYGIVRIFDQDDETVGDPIDDNSPYQDDYRYHDIFHLSHMAVLGWSPVMRSLLKRKRSDGIIDRVDDGGRAIAIEEGLTAYVFSEARDHDYFRTAARIPHEIIKSCQKITSHLEVSERSAADWNYAITAGYRVYRDLVEHRGGTVTADLRARTLIFEPPPS